MERIATFDNDDTLWLEKPLYIQLQHGLHAIGKMAAKKPEVRDRQPFKAVYEKDMAWLGKVGEDFARGDLGGVMTLASGFAEAFDGMAVEAFEADALEFLPLPIVAVILSQSSKRAASSRFGLRMVSPQWVLCCSLCC